MYQSTVDMIFNVLLLVFWFKLWTTPDDRNTFFNPYLSSIDRFADAAIRFLQPVFVGFNHKTIAALTLIFLIVFRGVVFVGMSGPENASWTLIFGFMRRTPASNGILSYVSFSGLSFLVFLFKLWSITLLYMFIQQRNNYAFAHPTIFLQRLSLPLSSLRNEFTLLILITVGAFIGAALEIEGAPIQPTININVRHGSFILVAAALTLVSLSALADILMTIANVMVLLIIGSFVATFTGNRSVMHFCSEWIDTLLGPLRTRKIAIGMFDLTPLIFLLAITMFVHPLLRGILYGMLANLL